MTTITQMTLEKILAAERDGQVGIDERNNKLAKEFLRRSALWADRLSCISAWPFFDIAATIDPSIELTSAVEEQLREYLRGPGHVGPLMGQLLLWSLRWATLEDNKNMQDHALPHPYTPILALYRRGGELVLHHGMILTPVYGFRPKDCKYYVMHEPYLE